MWSDHLITLPVLLPLVVGATLLLIDDSRRALKGVISVVSSIALLAMTIVLLRHVDATGLPDMVVYRVGNWDVPFGIVLVLDRLSALMLLVTALLAVTAIPFLLARWNRAGSHFSSLIQFLLVGLNGAFLTGDLFNLFVCLEVLLAASYGLVLHGSGVNRVTAGMHYIVVNLIGAFLLLIGISLLYGVTGTLNMADMAARIAAMPEGDRALVHAGAAILSVGLLIKAGMWPLCFWLPTAYSAASAPVAAIFAIMTKVGVYAMIRLWFTVFGPESAAAVLFGGSWILVGGLLTIAFGAIGVLASEKLPRLAAYCVLVSSGTVLAVVGSGHPEALGGALFYLVSSTLAVAAFFLTVELVDRGREPGTDILAVLYEEFGEEELREEDEIGIVIPVTLAFLGIVFMACALVLAGLPPLSGFIGKFAIFNALLGGPEGEVSTTAWVIMGSVILAGLATLISTSRAGIQALWAESDRELPRLQLVEVVPIVVLVGLCVGLTVGAGPMMRYMEDTATSLRAPQEYVRGVFPASDAADVLDGVLP